MKAWSYEERAFTAEYSAKMLEYHTYQRTDFPTYHGTPVPPEQLRGNIILPSQSATRRSGTAPVPHGPRLVCTSRRPYPFPVIRSLFHHLQPALQAEQPDFYLSRAANQRGALYIFVGATALQYLIDYQAKGYVYGCDGRLSKPNYLREDLEEYFGVAMNWFDCGQVDAFDLPPELLVIDDREREVAWDFIKAYKASFEPADCVAQQLEIELLSCSDYIAAAQKGL